MPKKTKLHAIKAMYIKKEGIIIKKGRLSASDNFIVQAVYIPMGNIIPQYCG